MAKRHQYWRAKMAGGRNNPQKSTVITTGSYKKRETFHAQAMAHTNPGAHPQVEKKPSERDSRMGRTHKADSQACALDRERRSGSTSHAHRHRKGF